MMKLAFFMMSFIACLIYCRHFNEMTKQQDLSGGSGSSSHGGHCNSSHMRSRTVSSPIPYVSPNSSRPLSPGKTISVQLKDKDVCSLSMQTLLRYHGPLASLTRPIQF